MASLQSDILGRIERLPMPPNEKSALLPLHEAISNSLHAVRDRFADETAERGEIEITVVRAGEEERVAGFQIADNGVGFNDLNYNSFVTPDSRHKMGRGGKGVGRLGWLKVFSEIGVDSHYSVDGAIHRRHFQFVLEPEDQIRFRPDSTPARASPLTVVSLKHFKSSYGARCPDDADTLVDRVIGHFLPTFAAGGAPRVLLHDGSETTDLREYFADNVKDQTDEQIEIALDSETVVLNVRHMKCDKAIKPKGDKFNWVILCANERNVSENCIDGQIGLKVLDGDSIYIGCVSGEYLDRMVNPQRDGFMFGSDVETEIRRRVAEAVKGYLHEYVVAALAVRKATTVSLIRENPSYLYIMDDVDSFVADLPASRSSREDIYVDMARHRFRRHRKIEGLEKDIEKHNKFTDDVAAKVEEYRKFVVEEQRGALADYVLKRKAVLELLDTLRGFTEESEKNFYESALHELICPMRVESTGLNIDAHNLWIVDDRLAFFNFFASDKRLADFSESSSKDRPDLAFFYDSCLAWREGDRHADKVVLVEFKRPGREDYRNDEPLRQVLGYVAELKRSGSVRDSRGRTITGIGNSTAFSCYIVADMTEGFRGTLTGYNLEETPDRKGLFGYTRNPDAYVEVIPYEKLLEDAKARNAIFFDKIGVLG